tara:strand:+ start:1452 stop:1772 length:321 start_codon:yes stop_codon:yes gene_type:complete
MKTRSLDQTLSSILYLLSLMAVLYGFSESNSISVFKNWLFKDIIFILIESYFDILIIGYLFICLQLSGYVELKYEKDYLTVSMLSVFLTPISLFFILSEKGAKDEN